MQSAIQLIKDNKSQFPDFDYYIPLMQKAVNNQESQPDICIETCKSLIEGVSKTILINLNIKSRDEVTKLSESLSKLVKEAVFALRKSDNVIEDNFAARCASLADMMGVLRNERGDISHGKAVPKQSKSNDKLSKLTLQMTESILYYMLDGFFILQVRPVSYDENPRFNNFLDKTNAPKQDVPYSKFLYDNDYTDYTEKMANYISSNGFTGRLVDITDNNGIMVLTVEDIGGLYGKHGKKYQLKNNWERGYKERLKKAQSLKGLTITTTVWSDFDPLEWFSDIEEYVDMSGGYDEPFSKDDY